MRILSPVVSTGYMTGVFAADQYDLIADTFLTDDTRVGGERIQLFHR